MRYNLLLGVIIAVSLIIVFMVLGGPVMLLPTILIVGVYFIPAVMSGVRKHPQKTAILIVNILLGWTFLGWIVALVWSVINHEKHESASTNRICLKCGNIVDEKTLFCAKCGNNLTNQTRNN